MSKRKTICPTCKQDMNDAAREGFYCLDCPQCGQGLRSLVHVADVLTRLGRAKAKPAGKVLFRGWIGKHEARSVKGFFANPLTQMGSAIAVYFSPVRNNGWDRRVEVRDKEGGK